MKRMKARMELHTSMPLLLLLLTCIVHHGLSSSGNLTSGPLAPALLVFGDSIVDTGNNNGLATIIKCNFPPYGKDFIDHEPTGRFTNAKNPSDMMGSILGLKDYIPAYLGSELSPEDIVTGVTFASGGTGFDPLTPKIVSVLSMDDQINLFEEYKVKLKGIVGEDQAATIISQSLYFVCAGTDDIANTYFSTPFRRPHYDIPAYVNLMTTSATSFIEKLYKHGARTIGFVGLPPIGCVPSVRTVAGGLARDCEPSRNQAALLYNSIMRQEIGRLHRKLEGSKVVFIDIYTILLELILKPSSYGFEESTKGCCGTGLLEVTILCNSKTSLTCPDDSKYVFWDSYHPTERGYQLIIDYVERRYLKDLI